MQKDDCLMYSEMLRSLTGRLSVVDESLLV